MCFEHFQIRSQRLHIPFWHRGTQKQVHAKDSMDSNVLGHPYIYKSMQLHGEKHLLVLKRAPVSVFLMVRQSRNCVREASHPRADYIFFPLDAVGCFNCAILPNCNRPSNMPVCWVYRYVQATSLASV